jgi:hypothetical protein
MSPLASGILFLCLLAMLFDREPRRLRPLVRTRDLPIVAGVWMSVDTEPPKDSATEPPTAESTIPPAPESDELQAHWDDLREALNINRMSDDDLRAFVDDFVSDRVFTSAHLRDHEMRMLPTIFLPVALGCFSAMQPDSLGQIGILYEYLSKAGPLAINGRPSFVTFKVMHRDDWTRARGAILREQERRKSIEL